MNHVDCYGQAMPSLNKEKSFK